VAKNEILRARTTADIDKRIERVLDGLGNPEPPLDLRTVRELLELDRGYYSAKDPGLLQETVSKLRIAGKQVILRPMLLIEAVRKMDIRALYIPDQKRILIDKSQPKLKHRWNEAHEIGHSLLPWHEGAMLGDNEYTLVPACHDQLEAEANFAAARLLFLREKFVAEAMDHEPCIDSMKQLKDRFGNTYTTTLWRCVEAWGASIPVVGLITGHPHPDRRESDFDPNNPCKHFIQSPVFAAQFSNVPETTVFDQIAEYCSAKRGGPLGESEVLLLDDNGDEHIFVFASFHNHWQTLTIGVYSGPRNFSGASRSTMTDLVGRS